MSFLRSNGIPTSGYDFGDSTRTPEELVETYDLLRYDLIGFSVYNESFYSTIRMAEKIKACRPDVFLFCGGPQATAMHDAIVRDFPSIDAVVRREGEYPALALVKALQAHSPLSTVPSLTWRREGAVVANQECPPVEDLDSLPFPDAHFESERPYEGLSFFDRTNRKLRPAIAIGSSRSCPYNCSFCGVLTIGRKYRARSPQSVVNELTYFRSRDDLDYTHVYFSDANFFVQSQRALAIVQALHAYDERVSFSFGTRVNQLLKAETIVRAMIPLGLAFVEIGVESASPDVLRRLSKGVGPEVNVAATRMLRRLGVEIALDFIMVDPATTLRDLMDNLVFLRQNGFADYYPADHLYTSLGLYEGTPIRGYFEERLGKRFKLGELPEIGALIESPDVKTFWTQTRSFQATYQGQIDRALAGAEFMLLDEGVCDVLKSRRGPDFQRLAQLQLDAVALRHSPTVFFEGLVERLAADDSLGFAEGTGRLEYGAPPAPLQSLIDRVVATTVDIERSGKYDIARLRQELTPSAGLLR
jgi:radical SAM superfamily enzyme YgiQ (UPF0313 family)